MASRRQTVSSVRLPTSIAASRLASARTRSRKSCSAFSKRATFSETDSVIVVLCVAGGFNLDLATGPRNAQDRLDLSYSTHRVSIHSSDSKRIVRDSPKSATFFAELVSAHG
jgi:hypothetical protein